MARDLGLVAYLFNVISQLGFSLKSDLSGRFGGKEEQLLCFHFPWGMSVRDFKFWLSIDSRDVLILVLSRKTCTTSLGVLKNSNVILLLFIPRVVYIQGD